MNVLMGKVPRTSGELQINGCKTEMQLFKNIIGYVPQDDILHNELTVRMNQYSYWQICI
jgi:ABC-type multidrug transport system ATPase subunit